MGGNPITSNQPLTHNTAPIRTLEPDAGKSLPPEGRTQRQPRNSRRQPDRAQGVAAALRRVDELHLYRSALQHRQPLLLV